MRVGFTLPPNASDLALLEPLLEDDVDYYEVAPETLWRDDGQGGFAPNDYHSHFAALRARTGRPFVAHGVGLSLGTVDPNDVARRRKWHERIRADHEVFDFEWYSDHLGATVLNGEYVKLPLPLPMTEVMADVVHDNLLALQEIVPSVAVENSVIYHQLGDMQDEPAFLARVVRSPNMHLVLDLHNVYTMAQNVGFDAHEYLDALDLRTVIEIHLSGGADADPAWFADGSTLRLDSHCSAVPDPVWALFERTLPRCHNLRGVTLERMESTVQPGDVQVLRGELHRIRSTLETVA